MQGEGAIQRFTVIIIRAKSRMDINLLKAEGHCAVPLAEHGLLQCDNDAAPDSRPEWVIYKYRTSHSILRWLPSKLAQRIGDNMQAELQIPAMTQAKWTVGELNQILANNLMPNGDGGHLRTITTLQWECELYKANPKLVVTRLLGRRWLSKQESAGASQDITCYITWYIS